MKPKIYVYLLFCIVTFPTFNLACAQMKKTTQKQIEALEKEKKSRNAAQQKIESHLLQAVRTARGEKSAITVIINPGDVDIDSNDLANVDIAAEVTDSLLLNIKKLGGEIIFPSKEYHTIRAKVPLLKIETIAGYAAVKSIQPAATAHNNKITPVIKP